MQGGCKSIFFIFLQYFNTIYIFNRIYLGSLTILDCHYRTYGVIFIGAFGNVIMTM